jgi:hypothetical protein
LVSQCSLLSCWLATCCHSLCFAMLPEIIFCLLPCRRTGERRRASTSSLLLPCLWCIMSSMGSGSPKFQPSTAHRSLSAGRAGTVVRPLLRLMPKRPLTLASSLSLGYCLFETLSRLRWFTIGVGVYSWVSRWWSGSPGQISWWELIWNKIRKIGKANFLLLALARNPLSRSSPVASFLLWAVGASFIFCEASFL